MKSNKANKSQSYRADVVIIGGGGAGLPAAVAATEAGLSNVTLIEKRIGLGGNAARAWGIFASESPVQKQALVDARNDDIFKLIMNWSHWSINPDIFHAFINKSGDTIRWLEAKGLKFDLPRYFPNQQPPVWHVPEGHGAQLIKVLADCCKKAGVKILLNTDCKKILCGTKGNVTGLIIEQDGKESVIKTNSVIIATGGYAGNKKLLQKYCRFYNDTIQCLGLPHKGDGLRIATEIGAAVETLGLLHLEWPHVHGDASSILTTIAREPYTVYVNNNGERFMDEAVGLHAFESSNAILRQPDNIGYVLIDDAIRKHIQKTGAILGRGKDRVAMRRGISNLKVELQSAAVNNKSRVKISNSWAVIADWIGTNINTLKSTINEYNRYCDQGYDQTFIKDKKYLLPLQQPPFYAIKAEPIFLGTLGGIKISKDMEVLNKRGDIIPGLYAAGADTGGWEPDTYCDALSGTAFGFAVNSGRIAGENAARCVNSLH